MVVKALDALKSSFGPNKEPPTAIPSSRNPQVLIHTPVQLGSVSQSSTPASSVRSSPPPSSTTSPKKHFSSSDPTLNHIDAKALNSRLQNQGMF